MSSARARSRTPSSRRAAGFSLLLLLMLVVGLCALDARHAPVDAHQTARGPAPPAPPPRPPTDPAVPEAVRAADEVAARYPGSEFGVAVLDRGSGELVGGRGAAVPMHTASVVKLLVVVDVVRRRDAGLAVSAEDEELIRRALGPSDDEAMNVLWDRFDGDGAVARVAAEFGLADTRPPEQPGDWGDTRSSARDVAVVLARAAELPEADRQLVVGAMQQAPRTGFGGFDQGFGLRAGDEPVAAKAGWMCCTDSRVTMHSTGLVGPGQRYAVALLSAQPVSGGYSQAREEVSEVARPVLDRLG